MYSTSISSPLGGTGDGGVIFMRRHVKFHDGGEAICGSGAGRGWRGKDA
jgi:hypothetical protein